MGIPLDFPLGIIEPKLKSINHQFDWWWQYIHILLWNMLVLHYLLINYQLIPLSMNCSKSCKDLGFFGVVNFQSVNSTSTRYIFTYLCIYLLIWHILIGDITSENTYILFTNMPIKSLRPLVSFSILVLCAA